jgi:hypothetical protein
MAVPVEKPFGGECIVCSTKNAIFAGFLILAVVEHASAQLGEVIVNGGFETGELDPWFNPASAPDKWSVVSDNPHTGMFSAFTSTADSGGVFPLSQSFEPIAVDDIISAGCGISTTQLDLPAQLG